MRATAYIKYDGGLKSLSEKLSKHLYLADFNFDTDIMPPHEMSGHCEALGCELWLKKSNSQEYNFLFSFETEMAVEERDTEKFYDISPWLVSHLKRIGEIECYTIDEIKKLSEA